MKKYFLIFPLLFLAFNILAHEGESVEKHTEKVAGGGITDIGPLVFGGVLGVSIIVFIVWLVLKKK